MLSKEQITQAASKFGLDYATVAAVASVESSGHGIDPVTNFPTILFEGHIFSRLTGTRFDGSFPTISYPRWTRKFYGKNQVAEHVRFDKAISLDRNAALQSTSYGMFQIMGFNFKECGCSSVQEFINKNCKSEQDQLEIFLNFIKSQNMIPLLKAKNWKAFARAYNGPDFAINRYDSKLANAHSKFA